ncbi:nitroreductase family protein [Xanthomonas floridensis]|uniref:Nitroreductase n=1 Tax=Xanthomonas floridensis TaxID=1843580 RepID=A0A1A9M943_9XANT|nr:nitroreductase family protein [Xanthomonas floridensis]MEA5126268.1 nitroreductase family protein [Xanthomonas floridensis]MEA5134156.1 nitroreductase family protein [Xanthomonas floridensis]OAG66571.1 nitroreductase [Xanthomonas floridensis]
MNTQLPRHWDAFQAANRFRRAIRKFQPEPIPEHDIQAILQEASLAPSSGNLQPYQLHWIRTPTMKKKLAAACNGQKAAASAADFVVVVASPALGRRTIAAQHAYVESASELPAESKAYYRKQLGMFQKILGLGSSILWSPLLLLVTALRPSLSLLPIGHTGSRHWAARNAIFAAQTLMLAAAAKGIDSCPMEGFSASQVARLLGLPRGAVIPLVIALGYRADDARIEHRWRLAASDSVILH